MLNRLCMNCFEVKGNYEVCPHCGHVEGTMPEQAYCLAPGTLLENGRYIIGMPIGFGGFSIIYKAYDRQLVRIFAMKEFYPSGLVARAFGNTELSMLSDETKEEYEKSKHIFLQEAEMIGKFEKENDIIKVFNYFEENKTAYIIMEYIEGMLLKDYMEQNPRLSVDSAGGITLMIIEAVKKVHAMNIIHRDISPDNIFLTKDNGIKLFDFGNAKIIDQGQEVSSPVIKPGYTPPEQYRKNEKQGFYTDIYAIGVIFYEMLTGEKVIEASDRFVKDELKKPTELGITLEPNIERAIMKALAVDIEYRFKKVDHFQEAILNKRVVEFPEVEKKKKKLRKTLTAVFLTAAVFSVAIGIQVFFTLFHSKGPLQVTLEEDTISVWVPVEEDSMETVTLTNESVEEDRIVQERDIFHDVIETVSVFLTDKEFEDNANITVQVVPIKQLEYEKAYEDAMEGKSEKELPVLFSTDYFTKDYKNTYADLGNLYESLNKEDYYFLQNYKEYFPTEKEIPMGFDTLFLYMRRQVKMKGTAFEKTAMGSTEVDLVKDILDRADEVSSLADFVGWDHRQFANTFYLLNKDIVFGKSMKMDAIIEYAKIIRNMQEEVKDKHGGEMSEKWFDSYDSDLAGIISDSTLLKSDNGVITAAKGNYEMKLLTKEGKSLAVFKDIYAINEDATENQKNAAMRLLAYMLTGNAQSLHYQQHKRAFPVLQETFQSYMDSESQFKELMKVPMLDLGTDFDSMIVDGKRHGMLYRTNLDLQENIFGKKTLSSDQVEQYLSDYE